MKLRSARAGRRGLSYPASVALVLCGGIFFSLMGLGVRLIEKADAWQILLYRSLGALPPLLMLIAASSRGRIGAAFLAAGWPAVVGGAVLSIAFAGSIVGLKNTTVANASFLFGASPFFTALLAKFFLGERIRMSTWLAMSVASLGIGIMVVEGLSAGHLLGNAAALISAMGFAAFVVTLRWNKSEDMYPAVFHAAVIAAIACTAISAAGPGVAVSARDAIIAIMLGSFALGLGMILLTIGSRTVPAAEVSLYCLSEIVLAPAWVWALLDERAGPLTLAGGGVLLLALLLNAMLGLRAAQPRQQSVGPQSSR
ncbi:MAG: DMT family transporter [Hyphomicrobiaceae bacterium]|nr:MAG: DMT family transporter [Hyphomicrobiaceae bacterium]